MLSAADPANEGLISARHSLATGFCMIGSFGFHICTVRDLTVKKALVLMFLPAAAGLLCVKILQRAFVLLLICGGHTRIGTYALPY